MLFQSQGNFPSSEATMNEKLSPSSSSTLSIVWCKRNDCIEVDAPIELIDIKRGERGIKEAGKASKSRFKVLSYDEATNTSTILCFPITGRQHQLRVHLSAIGFPIHNDILYGGEVENSMQDEMKTNSIQAIENAQKEDKCNLALDDVVTETSIKQAKEVSLCLQGKEGIEKAFNKMQLLLEGHAIDLHALSYRIMFEKKGKKKKIDQAKETVAVVELLVNEPIWTEVKIPAESRWLDK